MKHICIFTLFYALSMNLQAKNIVLNIPDDDIKIVENDVIDAEQWIKDAWAGKLAKCKERLVNQEIKTSIKNSEAIPAGDTAIIEKAFQRPGYESRKQREEKLKKVKP